MSDSNTPGDSTAGGPPPEQNPYGQQSGQDPYGQQPPPQYGQPQHGQPQYQQPQYQQPFGGQHAAYGQQPGYGQPYGATDPDKRPGTVTAAGIITIIFAALTLLAAGLGLIGMVASKQDFLDEFDQQANVDDAESIYSGLVAGFGIAAGLSLLAIILAILVLRRSNGARIALVVVSALTALACIGTIFFLLPAVNLIAAIAVIILLFTGGAGRWFKRQAPASATPGMQQY